MKQFCCGDVVPGCKALFQGTTEEQILDAVAEHAHRDHGLTQIPEALITQIRSLIRPVKVAPGALV